MKRPNAKMLKRIERKIEKIEKIEKNGSRHIPTKELSPTLAGCAHEVSNVFWRSRVSAEWYTRRANLYDSLNYWLGNLSVVFAAIVGAAGFTALSNIAALHYVTIVFGLITAAVVAWYRFEHWERQQNQRKALSLAGLYSVLATAADNWLRTMLLPGANESAALDASRYLVRKLEEADVSSYQDEPDANARAQE